MVDYGLSEEDADKEIAQKESETPPMPQMGYEEDDGEGSEDE